MVSRSTSATSSAPFSVTPCQGFDIVYETIARSFASLHSGLSSTAPPALDRGTKQSTAAQAQ
jgi:hypothetical protein